MGFYNFNGQKDLHETGYANWAASLTKYSGDKNEIKRLMKEDSQEGREFRNALNIKKYTITEGLVEQVQSMMAAYLPAGVNLDLIGEATLTNGGTTFCLQTKVLGEGFDFTVPLNIDVGTLMEMSQLEMQMIVCALVHGSIVNSSVLEGKALEEYRDGVKEEDKHKTNIQAENESLISDYVAAILKDLNPFKSYKAPKGKDGKPVEVDYSSVAKMYASGIVEQVKSSYSKGGVELSAEDCSELAVQTMFSAQKLVEAKRQKANGDEYVDTLKQARYASLLEDAGGLCRDGNEAGLEFLADSAELVSRASIGFSDFKSDSCQAFCQDFVSSFLRGFGVDSSTLVVTFENSGAGTGSFKSSGKEGQPSVLNINLENITSMTQLVSALTHELTHCLDHVSGVKERSGGFTSKDLKESGLEEGTPEYELFKKLNGMCYHLDPDEMKARQGELFGLKFMAEVAKENISMAGDLSKGIAEFREYQQNTIDVMNGLDDENSKYNVNRLARQVANCNVSEEVKQKMIERLNFIRSQMGMSTAKEQAAKDAAENMMGMF